MHDRFMALSQHVVLLLENNRVNFKWPTKTPRLWQQLHFFFKTATANRKCTCMKFYKEQFIGLCYSGIIYVKQSVLD